MASKGKKEKEKQAQAPPSPEQPPEREIIPGKLTESEWLRLLSLEDSSTIAAELVDELVDVAHSIIYSHYLERQSFPYSTQQAKKSLMQIIEWQFLSRDEGEVNTSADPSWTEDEEPVPAVIDSWARGIVPHIHEYSLHDTPTITVTTTPPPPPYPSPPHSQKESRAPSTLESCGVSTAHSSSTQAPTQKRAHHHRSRPVARRAEARMMAVTHPPPPPPPPPSHSEPSSESGNIEVSRPPLSCSPLSSTGHTGGHRGHQLLPYGMRPAQLRWQKDVSYDERGNILSITRLDPTKFPSHSVRPRVSVFPLEESPGHSHSRPGRAKTVASSKTPTSRIQKTPGVGGGRARERGREKGGRGRGIEKESGMTDESRYMAVKESSGERERRDVRVRQSSRFPDVPTLPSLVDTVDPSPGVVVREAGRSIRGPHPLRRSGPPSPTANMHPVQEEWGGISSRMNTLTEVAI